MHGRLLSFLTIWFLIDLYAFQAVRTLTAALAPAGRTAINWGYWIADILLVAGILYIAFWGRESITSRGLNWLIGGVILLLIPKLLVLPVLILEDTGRLIAVAVNWYSNHFGSHQSDPVNLLVARRRFVSQVALGIAAVPFTGILYGIVRGKYDYRVHRIQLAFKDLPETFHGFTVTQLSDIHSGSFDDRDAVERGIELANQQGSDLLLFTGDLVNNKAVEMDPWMTSFSNLRAAYGKFSVFGNHDYGDYTSWESPEAKEKNLERLKEIHAELGFRLLLNESVEIEKEGERITLAGVENWGLRGFHQYGDLDKALASVDDHRFKILLSHDPSHWEAQVLRHEKHVHLTLSGHTHGMQFGVEVPGFKWSPVQYFYKQWAGAYQLMEKHLYVNRGFGFLGFPGRVGILPEITVIELVRA